MTWSDVTHVYAAMTTLMAVICVLAYAVNRNALDLFAAGVVVFVFTVMSEWIVSALDPPWSSAHMPPQDVICAAVAWWSARRSAERWPRLLALAFTVQCGVHVLYWGAIALSYWFDGGQDVHMLTRLYPWPINALFMIELAILTAAGGGHVARYVRARLHLFRRGSAPSVSHRSWG